MDRWSGDSRIDSPRRRGAVWLVTLLVALAGVLALLSCQRPVAEVPRHLILITVDTLRADHLGLYGYRRDTSPRLDALGRDSVVFDRAIAQWPKTGASFASLFTGRYPQSTGLTHRAALHIPDDLRTLPRLLHEAGFTTVAVVSNPVLSKELGWDRGFDEYLETWSETSSTDPLVYRKELNAVRVNQLAQELLKRYAGANRLFAWIHYSDPHAPYVLPQGEENPFLDDATFRETPAQDVDLRGTKGRQIPGHSDHRYYVAQYDANIRVADRHIGVLLDELAELGLLDDAVTVVTADHGESLGEHGLYYEHGPLPYNATAHVPLLVHRAGLAPRRVAEPVELVDLLPTLLRWLLPDQSLPTGSSPPGASLPTVFATLEGDSLLPTLLEHEAPSGPAFSEAGYPPRHFRSVQDRRWKLVLRNPRAGLSSGASNFELYDLERDPGETRNLTSEAPQEIARLSRPLRDWLQTATQVSDETQRPRGRQELRALEVLGYMEELESGAAPPEPSPETAPTVPAPKAPSAD